MEQLIPLISQIGFPAFVAVFMMTKTNATLEGVKEALTDLKIVIEKQNSRGEKE